MVYHKRRRTNLQILKENILHNEIGKDLENLKIDKNTNTISKESKPRDVELEQNIKQKKITYINTKLLLTKR